MLRALQLAAPVYAGLDGELEGVVVLGSGLPDADPGLEGLGSEDEDAVGVEVSMVVGCPAAEDVGVLPSPPLPPSLEVPVETGVVVALMEDSVAEKPVVGLVVFWVIEEEIPEVEGEAVPVLEVPVAVEEAVGVEELEPPPSYPGFLMPNWAEY
jgi:hypothetical protein